MSPAIKKLLSQLGRIHKLSPEMAEKLGRLIEKGEVTRDVIDDFISGAQNKVYGGLRGAKVGSAGAAVAEGAMSIADRAGSVGRSVGAGAASAGRGALTGLRGALPWAKVLGKGALVGLGGAGALYTLSQVPGMIGDGLDMLEDQGLDPRGTRQPHRAMLQNQINAGLAEGMDERTGMAQLEKSHEVLARMEGMEQGSHYGELTGDAARKSRMLREMPFLEAHSKELEAIQRKAQLQDAFEAAAMRLMGD